MAETTPERIGSMLRDAADAAAVDHPRGITRRTMVGFLIAAPTLVAGARWGAGAGDGRRADGAAGRPLRPQRPPHRRRAADVRAAHGHDQRRRHRVVRPAARRGRPGHHDGGRDDDRRRARAAGRQGEGHARRRASRSSCGTSSPAASNTMHALYEPLRTAAASARGQLARDRGARAGRRARPSLTLRDGVFTAPDGRTRSYAAARREGGGRRRAARSSPQLKARAAQQVVGRDQRRIDARDAVTGRKPFAMDLDVPDALPTMVCRPPTINAQRARRREPRGGQGDAGRHRRRDHRAQPVRAGRRRRAGEDVRAVHRRRARAEGASGAPGTVDGKSADDVLADLKANELPLTPALPGESIEEQFTFHFRPGDALEPNCAVADVRADRAEIWSSLKSPIWAQEQIALSLGLPPDKTVVHVTEGGGSFGRHLFCDAAFEAACDLQAARQAGEAHVAPRRQLRATAARTRWRSRACGSPTPAATCSPSTSATRACRPTSRRASASSSRRWTRACRSRTSRSSRRRVFTLTANVPYNFGAVTQLLNEIYEFNTFNTSSVRNVYSPNVATAARADGRQGRRRRWARTRSRSAASSSRDERLQAVLDKVRRRPASGAGAMPAGTAQGVAIHREYKGASRVPGRDRLPARRPSTARSATATPGPRVTKVVFAVDAGLPINPLGIKAQIMGGVMDGIANALTYSLHLEDGHFLEAQLGQRALHAPVERARPRSRSSSCRRRRASPAAWASSASAPSMAADACAYARATGKMPTEFPINHHEPLGFEPFPTVPPIPAVADRRARLGGRALGAARRRKRRRRRSARRVSARQLRSRDADTHVHPQRQAVSADVEDDVRLLWVLRDVLGVTGPKYGCGIGVCKACTCHINGKAFNPCSVPVSDDQADRPDHDDRGPAGDGRPRAAPDAGGVAEGRRRAVRLLPARADHDRGRARQRGPRRAAAARSPTPTSTRSATSAAAAPTRASARRSARARRRCRRRGGAQAAPAAQATAARLALSRSPAP